MKHTLKRVLSVLLALAMLLAVLPAASAQAASGGIVLADQSGAAPIYIDRDGGDYDGLSLIAMAAAEDFEAVTGSRSTVRAVATSAEPRNNVLEPGIKDNIVSKIGSEPVVIIAGTLNDKLIQDLGLDWDISPSGESFKAADFERYQIKVVTSGSQTRVIIAGADKRGACYGLFHITQDLGGVSPWIWWGDVVPAHRDSLAFSAEELEIVSKRPSVNYRGFFFNDENPNLDGFADSHYGGLNYMFYNEVFELMLRLKGNFLWPAMWSNSFNSDGVEGLCNSNAAYSSLANGNQFAKLEAENHYLLGGAMYVDRPGNAGASVSAPNTNTTNMTAAESQALGQGSLTAIGRGDYPMTLANAVLADRYGVLVGASHHEPMARAGVEWQNLQGSRTYNQPTVNNTSLNAWNYMTNPTNLSNFWSDGIKRNGSFDNLLTIGMRGENDTALTDANGRELSTKQNAELLKDVIREQDRILHQYGLEDTPQLLALYKEVENCWYGGDRSNPNNADKSAALVFDEDITSLLGADTNRIVMFCEDNNGYLRTLGEYGEKDRFNYGLYYHFDFVGSPHTSMWTNTMPLQRSWDNLTTAYEYGVDDAWMFNVGDLKPMELPLSYVMDMAYDFETYGTAAADDTDETITWEEYTLNWVKQQFGAEDSLKEEDFEAIADILTDYTHLNGNRKPEQQQNNTYSLTAYNEAQETLAFAQKLGAAADKYLEVFKGTDLYDAYYQLVYYTGKESATVNQVLIYWGLNRYYANANSALANVYADKVDEMLANDRSYTAEYNKLGPSLNGRNKWYRMMLASPFNGETVCGITALGHLNYSGWNRDSAQPFSPTRVSLTTNGQLRVDVPGSSQPASSGTLSMPAFDSNNRQCYALTLSNTGTAPLDYEITGLPDWVVLDAPASGKVYVGKTIAVSVDWSKLSADATASLKIASGSQSFTVNLSAKVVDVPADVPDGTAFIANDVFSFIATNYTDMGVGKSKAPDGKTVGWTSMPGYGKTNGTMKPFPVYTDDCAAGEGPWLDYKVYVPAGLSGSYQLNIFFGQGNDLSFFEGRELNFATQVNGGAITTRNALQNNYIAGNNSNGPWTNNIKECGHVMNYGSVSLQEGVNTLRIYAMDQNMLLQKIVLSRASGFQSSYTGAPQSWRKGDPVVPQAMVHDVYNDHEHEYETVVTPPTCTEDGYTAGVCRICGLEAVIETVKALGHDWDEGRIITPATEEAPGLGEFTCRRCGLTRTRRIPRIGATVPDDIDFTDPASADQFQIVGQESAAIVAGEGVSLITSQGGVEPAKQSIAETPRDVIEVPVDGDWAATLEFVFNQNGASNGYYQFFGFYAATDYQNMVGIRGGDGAMQDFIRRDGAITEETRTSSPGLASNGTFWYRIEKEGDSYTCLRSSDGDEFTEMFVYTDTGIDAEKIVIDAYTGMTTGYKFTLKSLKFEDNGGSAGPTVSKTALNAAISKAERVARSRYTDESLAAMDAALAAARAAKDSTEQSVIDAAAAALEAAVAALVEKEVTPVDPGSLTNYALRSNGGSASGTAGVEGNINNVIDGAPNKNSRIRWASDDLPATLTIELSEIRTVRIVDVISQVPDSVSSGETEQGMTTNLGLKGITVSASADGSNWEVIGSGDPNNDLAWQRFTLAAPVDAKYVKIDIEREDTFDGWARVLEVQVWGSPVETCEHNYVAVVTAPTCTEKGFTTYTCSKCGASYQGDEVAALGHAYGEWAVTKAATCTEKGEETRACTRCGAKETRETAVLGHDYRTAVTAPTCTEAGYTAHTCSRCGFSYNDSETEALGHDYKDGVCTRCGAKDPDYVPPIEKAALQAAIAAAEQLDLSKYTDATADAVSKALAAAKAALEADTQAAVDAAKEALTAAVNALVEKEPFRFDDVKDANQYYYAPVYWAVEQGITNGTSKTEFSPEKGCTRAQVVTFLWRAAGEPKPTATTCEFKDVKADAYYYSAVLWAVENNITNGTSKTTFDPEKTCTRAQIVTFLWRAAKEPKPTAATCEFTDVKAGAYYYNAVLWAVEKEITNGTSKNTFDPEKTCTRAQIVTFLYRAK